MAGRKSTKKPKQTARINVLGAPRKNRWGTRFNHSVHLNIIDIRGGRYTPITGSFASRIIAAKKGANLKGFALINGISMKIAVHKYY